MTYVIIDKKIDNYNIACYNIYIGCKQAIYNKERKMKKNEFQKIVGLTFLVLMISVTSIFAQGKSEVADTFPSKQITLIVQAGAGGSSDTNCRTIAPGMEEYLGVPVVSENRPGATGGVAISYGKAQPADGYTINHLPVDWLFLKPMGIADVQPSDFETLCRVAYHGAAIAVKADSEFQNLDDYLAYAKANPGELTVGNAGIGSAWHLAAVQLEDAANIKLSHIPYEGAAPSVTSLLGGHIDSVICSPAEVGAQVLGGDLRLLSLYYDERIPKFPNVPTLKEQGIDLSLLVWLTFGVPAGTPQDVCDKLVEAFKFSYDSDTYQSMLKSYGMEPGWLGQAEATKFVAEEYAKYSKLIPQVMGK